MKKLTILLMLFVSVLSLKAEIKTGSCGNNVTYTLDTETGVLTISGNGAMTHYSYRGGPYSSITTAPWGEYASDLTSVVIEDGVTVIGQYAFYRCSRLTSITIPNSVEGIGFRAFRNCSSLTSVTIPNSVIRIGSEVFQGCTGLTSVTIPNSVKSIDDFAFDGCSSLTSVVIPNSVTSIGSCAFSNCYKLKICNLSKLDFSSTGYGCVVYDANSISTDEVNKLSFLTTDNGDVILWDYKGSSTELTLPEKYNGKNYSIGSYVFSNCSSLASVNIPNSVTSIGDSAFYGCSGLTSVTIPNSVTFIGDGAFGGCSGLTSVNIPNSVTFIGDGAFKLCHNLTSVIIPSSVINIGVDAFFWCESLASVSIPNSVKSIDQGAFYGCNLGSVEIPGSVTNIGEYAFFSCINLTSITSYAIVPPICAPNVFQECSNNITLLVFESCAEAYRNADVWKDFKIETIPDKNYELVDGEPYTNTRRTTYDAVSFSKTFSATNVGKWNALYVPISINVTEHAADFDIAEIYAFCSTVDTNGDGTVDANDERFLFVRPLTNGQTYPNTPYLIRPREAKNCAIKSADNVLYEKRDGKVEFSTTRDKFVVTGLNEEFTVTANDNNYYVSGSGKLSIRTSGSTTVKPNRWIMHREDKEYSNIPEYVDDSNHLENDENADSGVKAYTIIAIGEDISEADAILAVKNANGVFVKGIYTLDGRLVDNSYNLPAGVYIKNGKKVIIK